MFPVPDERLAEHLGLKGLHVGAARVGDTPAGPRVLAWWSVAVQPSFAPAWSVGAVHEEKWVGGPDPDWVAARGFVADRDAATVVALDADEVPDALGRLNPFRVTPARRVRAAGRDEWVEVGTLDGLGYTLRWQTKAAAGGFRFANPRADWLVGFERVLFRFARRVIAASGAGRFEDHLRRWAEYREGVGGA